MKKTLIFTIGFLLVPLVFLSIIKISITMERIEERREFYNKTINANYIRCNNLEVKNGKYIFDDSKRKVKPNGLDCLDGNLNDISDMSANTLKNLKYFSLSTPFGTRIEVLQGMDKLKELDNLSGLAIRYYNLSNMEFLKSIKFDNEHIDEFVPNILFRGSVINDEKFMDYVNGNDSIVTLSLSGATVNGCFFESALFRNTPKPWVLPSC